MSYQIGKNALPVITGPIIPTGWLWAMLRMMPVPNCCPGNAGYRPCRFPSGCRKIPGIEYVPFSCLHNTLVNLMTVVENAIEHSKSNPRNPGCYNRCIRSYLWSYYTPHRQALAVAGYHAGTHWCSKKCRVSMVPAPNIKPTGGLRQLPDIPPVPLGAPENCANRQGLAGAGSHASSTYAGLIRGYMDVTFSLVCRINMAIRHSA